MTELLKLGEAIGWKFLINSTRWHFFDADGCSLCGKWMSWSCIKGELDKDESPNNCAACRRKVQALRARAKEQGE